MLGSTAPCLTDEKMNKQKQQIEAELKRYQSQLISAAGVSVVREIMRNIYRLKIQYRIITKALSLCQQ